jgi:hypothetical protein
MSGCGDGQMLRNIFHTFSTENPNDRDSLGRKRYIPPKLRLLDEPQLRASPTRLVPRRFSTSSAAIASIAGPVRAWSHRSVPVIIVPSRPGIAREQLLLSAVE